MIIMVTPIEILDTAVKIGLGALISGAAAYFVARLNHIKEVEKSLLSRRREILEEVSEHIAKFTKNFENAPLLAVGMNQSSRLGFQRGAASLWSRVG